jgi:hypothetical protein
MAKQTKKDLEKRRKERDRKRQAVSDLARAAGITPWIEPIPLVPAPHVELPAWAEPAPTPDSAREGAIPAEPDRKAVVTRSNPPPPPREETEEEKQIRCWWQEYRHADGERRLQMAREKLAALDPDDEQFEAFFPDAISEVESKTSRERYVEFLEEIRDRWPRVFCREIDWNVWQMAFVYVAEQRWPDLERAVDHMSDELKDVREPFFSLVSLLRLANRGSEVQRLVDAAVRLRDSWDLMPWAVDEIFGWTLLRPCQEFVQAGATDEAFDRFWSEYVDLGGKDTAEARESLREFGLHLAGLANKRWTRQELLTTKKRIARKINLLLVDYQHWLVTARQVPPIVADEFRIILTEIVHGMTGDLTGFLRGLKRTVFEPRLARKLDFMSLDRFHASAGVLAMYHFYDFLAESQLVDETIRRSSQQVCLDLWDEIKTLFQEKLCEWRPYQFLEQYATWRDSAA